MSQTNSLDIHFSPKGPPRFLIEACVIMTKSGLACVYYV